MAGLGLAGVAPAQASTAGDVTVSGTISDGSGHNWPLHAEITIGGYSGGPVFTNPFTGSYSLTLPQSATYELHITPLITGYLSADVPLTLGKESSRALNQKLAVDASACDAPGYVTQLGAGGTKLCVPVKSGLVEGVVTNGYSGAAMNGATVSNVAGSGQPGVTGASADPAYPKGLYWLVSPVGSQQFTAAKGKFVPSTATVNVGQNTVTEQDFTLAAGHATVSKHKLSATERLGKAQTRNLLFTDNGTAPVHIKLGEKAGTFTALPGSVLPDATSPAAAQTDAVPWLTESQTDFTVQPGGSVTVTVTADSSAVALLGTYTASLTVQTDSPYQVKPIAITAVVNPPLSWGKISGTVLDSSGNPLAGATVQVCTQFVKKTEACGPVSYTLMTDSSGSYQLWLSNADNPVHVIVAKDGYQPVAKIVQVVKQATVTAGFTLATDTSS